MIVGVPLKQLRAKVYQAGNIPFGRNSVTIYGKQVKPVIIFAAPQATGAYIAKIKI